MAELSIYASKTAVVFLSLYLAFRLLGKRQMGQLNLYDLALIMCLSNAVQNAMTAGKGDLSIGIVASSTLLIVGGIITQIIRRSQKLERFMIGMPVVLVNKGVVLKDRMRGERVTREQLLAAIRSHGLESASQINMAVLEVDGSISIIPKGGEMDPTEANI